MEKTLPEYLQEGEGFIDITLHRAHAIGGAKVSTLRMREPVVRDQLAAQARGGTDAEVEVAAMANLLEVTPEDLHGMSMRNYKRIQRAFVAFTD